MFNKINHLAYNQKLSILAIHFIHLCIKKRSIKSISYALCPLNGIRGHKGGGLGKLLSGIGFAKSSTSVGAGGYTPFHTNSRFNIAQFGVPHA